MTTNQISIACSLLLALGAGLKAQTEPVEKDRIRALEEQLAVTQRQLAELQGVVRNLIGQLGDRVQPVAPRPVPEKPLEEEDTFTDRILVKDLGHDEREHKLEARPELFIQSRYHALPIKEATSRDITPNLGLNRMELRWAGRLSEKIGMGYEIQFHPAPEGAAEELINDAFLEYYPNQALTFRVGQFIKPFGFDIQHSSSARESPERGIFAGYFFPGQRDRGLMMTAKLDGAAPWLRGTTFYGGVFNGNRFFNDSNRQVNYNFRVRKVMDSVPVAIGASAQLGKQLLPPGLDRNNNENVYGVDLQFVIGRLGVRAEYAVGNMPSTLLSLEPEFAPGFIPGSYSSAGAVFFNYSVTRNDEIYWRYDQFNNDPVTSKNARAFNLGYLRKIGANSRLGIDYQFKNRVTYNDDELNTKLAITWNVIY